MSNNLCVCCLAHITSINETTEHILLKKLGDTHTSKHVLCSQCNQHLGEKLDQKFLEAVQDL